MLYLEGGSSHITADMNDIEFWIKPTFNGEQNITLKIGVFYTIRNEYSDCFTIPASKNGQWIKVSLNELSGGDWKSGFGSVASRNVGRIEICFSGNEGDKLVVGSALESISSTYQIPENTESWTLSDWLYATANINPKHYNNSEDFIAARKFAYNVRDNLLIARSSKITEYSTYKDAETYIDAIDNKNIIAGTIPSISVCNGKILADILDNDTVKYITDQNSNTEFVLKGLAIRDSFVDFTFDAQGSAQVEEFIFANGTAMPPERYYIYVGDTRSELFTSNNLVTAYTPNGDNQIQSFIFKEKMQPSGKFIGLRIYNNGSTITIPEFYAFGQVSNYTVETGTFDDAKIESIGENLIKGIEPKFKEATGSRYSWWTYKGSFSANSTFENLTDGNAGTGIGYYQQPVESADDKTTLHIFYDLGDTYTVEKLLLCHADIRYHQTGEYEIYASNDMATLFSGKNKIITYDNRVNGPNGTSTSQVLTLNKQINARYVSFCIKFPVSDYEKLISGTNQGIGIRLMELGVYGPRYYKPYALVNLGARTSLTVTRTDATGKSTKLNDGEYDGTEHKFTYDGKTDTYASVGMAEGEKLEFFYDLAADQVINKLQIKTNAGTIKQMKVYASDKLEDMYKSTSMVFNYNAAVEDMGNEVFVDFTESPRNMRYVRFVIEDIEGEVFEPSEIEIIGGNDQEFFYNNLAEGKSDTAAFFTTDKNGTVAISEHANKWKFGHTTWSVMYHSGNALDNDPDTVFDFYGGKNGEESLNMLIDMGTLNSIDNIQILGGSSEQYWPDEINFYFSTNDLDLYTEKAVPAKKWTSKSQDGVYSFDFVPQIAQYVRVEILRSDDTIYSAAEYGDKIATVLSEIQVNGLEARVVSEEDYVYSRKELSEKLYTIKNAYGKMYSKMDSLLYPSGEAKDGNAVGFIGNDRIFNTALEEKEKLGNNYAYYSVSDSNLKSEDYYNARDKIVFYTDGDMDLDGVDITNYDGFYFNVYYNDIENSGAVGCTLITSENTVICGRKFNVTARNKGKWVTYTDMDIYEGGLSEIKAALSLKNLSALMLNIEDGLSLDATVGSIVFYKNTDNSHLNINDETFLNDMRSVDLKGYGNTQQFTYAIIDATNELSRKCSYDVQMTEKIKFEGDCNAYGGTDIRDLARIARYIDSNSKENVKIDILASDKDINGIINFGDENAIRTKLLYQ